MILADAAEQLLHRLPPGERERLDGLPDVMRELRMEAERARERMGQLPEGDERARAAERLATSVAALDGVRLELLRLGAGLAPTSGLTAQIRAALQLGEDVDARLGALRQLERMLGVHHPSPRPREIARHLGRSTRRRHPAQRGEEAVGLRRAQQQHEPLLVGTYTAWCGSVSDTSAFSPFLSRNHPAL